jgi:AcrR family transcriptional regulator
MDLGTADRTPETQAAPAPRGESAAGAPAVQATDGRRARGDRTRQAILERAVQIASAEGLEGLSIGRLASELGVSKSGLFAHFGSKVELQLATVDEARQIFIREVIGSGPPDSGVGGVMWLTDSWLAYMEREVFVGGCFFAAASIEFDSRPGPVRDRVASMMGEWMLALEAAIQDAQESGELSRDLDSEQLAFEINSLGLGANWAFQLYRDEAAFSRARTAIHEKLFATRPAPPAAADADMPGVGVTELDEQAARRSLRGQIAKLERELSSLFVSAFPGRPLEWQVSSPGGGPRVLDVADLEALRDELAGKVEAIRRELSSRSEAEGENRQRIEALIADPASHKWERISNADIGEPGCKYWHSTPRFGLVGMLMGWWRVKISSGCP